MTGWIVEKTRRSGWRQKWRRFRIVTTPMSVTLDSASRSDGACAAREPTRPLHGARRARPRRSAVSRSRSAAWPVSWRKTSSSVGRRRPMSLTPIPARRSSAAASSTRTRLVPRRGQGQPVRPLILLRCAAADAKQRGLRLVTLLNVGQLDLEDLAADAVFQLVAGALRNHAAVIDDGDLVRELIRFFEVLRRQQDRRALAAQVADDVPDLVATSRIETCCRLVEEEHTRLREHAGREVEPPPHPARIRLRGSVGGVRELEALEELRRSAACLRAREPEQPPEHLEVLAARQELVDGRELTGQGQLLAHLRRVGDDIETEQLGPSRVWPKQASPGCERGSSSRRRSGRGGRRPFLPAPPGRRRQAPSSTRTA